MVTTPTPGLLFAVPFLDYLVSLINSPYRLTYVLASLAIVGFIYFLNSKFDIFNLWRARGGKSRSTQHGPSYHRVKVAGAAHAAATDARGITVEELSPRQTIQLLDNLLETLDNHEKRINDLENKIWKSEESPQGGQPRAPSTKESHFGWVYDNESSTAGAGGRADDRRDKAEETPRHVEVRSEDSHQPSAGRGARAESQADELCRLYNEASPDKFRDRYQQSTTRISTTNADVRRRNPNAEPEYNTTTNGEFMVVRLQQGGEWAYAAVPYFDLQINELIYGAGALGKVFNCHGYQPGQSYRRIKVLRPAYFTPKSDTGWKLDEPGELEVM